MSDIFLSYAREDLQRAHQLAQALGHHGWEVFWDPTIPAGRNWRTYLGERLEQTSCVVVVWSKVSARSNWVIEEAERGLEKNALVPVFFEAVRPPLGFGQIHAEDLSSWNGDQEFVPFSEVAERYRKHHWTQTINNACADAAGDGRGGEKRWEGVRRAATERLAGHDLPRYPERRFRGTGDGHHTTR